MEYEIGRVITLPDGRKVKVVEVFNGKCDGCLFKGCNYCHKRDYCISSPCSDELRTDKKNIIYKEIKED